MPAVSIRPSPDEILRAVNDNIAGVDVVRTENAGVEVLAGYLHLKNTEELIRLVSQPRVQQCLQSITQVIKVCLDLWHVL